MMTPSDVTQLVVLGAADRVPTSLAEVVETARTLAPFDWQPTADTIEATVERALIGRLIEFDRSSTPDRSVLRTTPLGRLRLLELLRLPTPQATGGFVRTCLSAKACFLDHLPLLERGGQAAELPAAYRDSLGILHRLNQLPDLLAGSSLRDLRNEIMRLDSEVAWLNAMAAWRPMRIAAE